MTSRRPEPRRGVAGLRPKAPSWLGRALLATFLVITALQAVRPMVSYRALEVGASAVELGVVAGSYALLASLLAVPVGRAVDRAGHQRFVVAGATTVTVVSLLLVRADSVAGLAVAHALLGIGQLSAVVALQALMTHGGGTGAFDGRFGLFTAVTSVAQIAGPMLGGFIGDQPTGGPARVFVVSAVIAGAGALVALSLWRWPPPAVAVTGQAEDAAPPGRAGVRQLLGQPGMRQGLLASLVILAAVDILIAYLPLYGERHGLSVATVGVLLAVRAGTSTGVRVVMVWLIRGLGRKRLLTLSMLVTAAALAALPLLGDRVALLVVAMALSGTGLGVGQPMTMSWVAANAPSGQRATALSVRISGNRIGQLTLPFAVGVLAGAVSVSAVFVGLGVVLAATAAAVSRTAFGTESS